MKSYDEAIYRVAEVYAYEKHDSFRAIPDIGACKIIAFIFDSVNVFDVLADVEKCFEENREKFWK